MEESTARSRIRERIRLHLDELDAEEFTLVELTEKLRAALEESEPDVLHQFLLEHQFDLLRREIGDVMVERRSVFRYPGRRHAREDSESDGDSLWDQEFLVDESGLRRKLADMTGSHHSFQATYWRKRESFANAEARFFEALAERCGRRKTKNVMTSQEVEDLRRSLREANGV